MSKQQIIEAIHERNHSANIEFLATFNKTSLNNYLRRLKYLQNHRGRRTVWVRPGDTHSIVTNRH